MSLEQIVDNTRTDKNTTHSYLPLYESLFKNKKETTQNILEIGFQNGGSIKLWRDYFINATWMGRAKMERWDPGAANSRRKVRTNVHELVERRKARAQTGQSWEGLY
jgi:hypothetical protein